MTISGTTERECPINCSRTSYDDLLVMLCGLLSMISAGIGKAELALRRDDYYGELRDGVAWLKAARECMEHEIDSLRKDYYEKIGIDTTVPQSNFREILDSLYPCNMCVYNSSVIFRTVDGEEACISSDQFICKARGGKDPQGKLCGKLKAYTFFWEVTHRERRAKEGS